MIFPIVFYSIVVAVLLVEAAAAVDAGGSSNTSSYNLRRDFFLDEVLYPEGTWSPIPKEGGRLQIVSAAAKNLSLALPLSLDFGGFNITLDPALYPYPDGIPTNGLDWCHSQYHALSGTLFTSLHGHTDALLLSISQLRVTDSNGLELLYDSSFKLQQSDLNSPAAVQVTYATTRNDFAELVVHLHNYDAVEHSVERIAVNGGEVVDSTGSFTLPPGGHAVRVIDVSALQLQEAAVWTVALYCDGQTQQPTAAFGGRLNKELFPIEDWPKSAQCPFPVDGANSDNFKLLRDELHVNTHFMGSTCDGDSDDVFAAAVDSNGEWYVLPEYDSHFSVAGNVPDWAADGVAAAFIGDESDSSLESTWDVWARVLQVQRDYNNRYALYVGGHSNHLNGAFAGLADIQGMDFYVAGCAPHITLWTSTMRIQGSFDYLRTARENHKPLTTWFYSQAFCSDCWSIDSLETGELLVQLGSVLAAGGKGLMLFQSDVLLRDEESWTRGGEFLASAAALGPWLRVADVQGARFTTSANASDSSSDGGGGGGSAITEVLAAPDGLLFIAISTAASGYNDKTCFAKGQHWIFEEQTIAQTTIELPAELLSAAAAAGSAPSAYFRICEMRAGECIADPSDVSLSLDDETGSWLINDLLLGSSTTVVRMFWLTNTELEP